MTALYCWTHRTVHPFTTDEVEQVVYALTGALADQETIGALNKEPVMTCPRDALSWARDGEGYLEHVEQGVACREDAEVGAR
jgi:hypothetical protein